MSTKNKDNPWAFYGLPPFFTEQPAPGTLERQTALWSALLLDHAVYYGSQSKEGGRGPALFARCDIFANQELKRRLSTDGARTVLHAFAAQHPNVAVITRKEPLQVLVAANRGGLQELEQSLLNWVMDMGEGTTTTMLAKKGAVLTFEEMAEQKALHYGRSIKTELTERVSATSPLPCGDTGAITEEQAVRLLFAAQKYRTSGSPLHPFGVTLFNLDGSDGEPYQGVKLGGGN
eukprot:gene5004-3599_t